MKTKKRFLCTIDEEDGKLVTLKMAPVDLCTLLRLADELEREGLACWASGPVNVGEYARRIREALGANDG